MKRSILVSALLVIVVLLGGHIVRAQTEQFDYSGYMGDDVADDRYPVTLGAGDLIMVEASAIDDSLDTYLTLEGPGGAVVAVNDDRGDGTYNSALGYIVPTAGDYTVVMSNFPETSGDYALTVRVTAGAANRPAVAREYRGYMSDDVADDFYTVMLGAGDVLSAEAFAASGDLDTMLYLQDSAGNVLLLNDDRDNSTYNSALGYIAPTAGEYTIIVSNYPGSSGDYALTLTAYGDSAVLPEASEPGTAPPGVAGADTATETVEDFEFSPDVQRFTGYMGDDVPDNRYPVTLEAGETLRAVALADAGSALDTYLALEDPTGKVVRENDDRRIDTFNSEVIFTAAQSGTYTVVMSNYPQTSGSYILMIDVLDPAAADILLANMADVVRGIEFSGTPLQRETPHFLIHYTLEGDDATTEAYVGAAAQALEEVYQLQIVEAGWPIPPSDGDLGGDARLDVYIMDLLKESGEGALGLASVGDEVGDNPNTAAVEGYATHSYLLLDNDLDAINEGGLSAFSLLRATIAHEFHHAIQHGYDLQDAHLWYYEATATWMETFTFPDEQDATGYVAFNYEYPEICFGADGDADPGGGQLMYGDWMFVQSLVDVHGEQIVRDLWTEIAQTEGFAPLTTTLTAYNDDIVSALARYRVQNLVRDYDLAPLFGATVWLEGRIDGAGSYSPAGSGVQELGANYFRLNVEPGPYAVSLNRADAAELQLWGVGIRGAEADAFEIGRSGIVDTTGYNDYYLMVFHTGYDDDITSCVYEMYTLDIKPDAAGKAPAVTQTWDAAHFEPLSE